MTARLATRAARCASVGLLSVGLAVPLEAQPASSPVRPPAPDSAVAGAYLTESWTVRDGLPVNSVTALLHARDGYLWIATFDGLARFDGVRFTVFTTANTPGMPSDRLIRLVEGCDRSLWLVTEQGHLVRFRDGRAVTVLPALGLGAGGAHLAFEEPTCTLWFTIRGGLGVVRPGADSVAPVASREIAADVTALTLAPGGGVVVAAGGRVHRIGVNGEVRALVLRGPPVTGAIGSVYAEGTGAVWATDGRGVWGGRDTLTFTPRPIASLPEIVNGMQRSPRTGALWLYATYGVYRLREGTGGAAPVVERVHAQLRRTPTAALWADSADVWYALGNILYREGRAVHALPTGGVASTDAPEVWAALVDREGSVWLGTQASGLHRLTQAVFRVYGTPEGMGGNNVYPIAEDGDEGFWLGTWGTGVSHLDPATGSVSNHGAPDGVPPFVQTILDDGPGRLLLGAGDGLRVCDVGARLTCRIADPPALRSASITALFRDDAGAVWAAGPEGIHRRESGVWRRVAGAPAAAVRAVARTPDGALWMATNGAGLARWADGRFTAAVTRADGLPTDAIRALHVDRDGWLWIGTEGSGVVRLDPRAWAASPPPDASRRLARIGAEQGLFDGTVHQLLVDDADRVWMSTNRGIHRVARADLLAVAEGRAARVVAVAYTERDGMRNREANGGYFPMGLRALDGRLWFPTQGGAVVVDPRQVERARVTPPVAIEQVVTPERTRLAGVAPLTLAAGERDLEIHYTAPTFVEPATLRFRYQLEGYDADWVEAGSRRTAFYTQVPPGRYTFRVAVGGDDGAWSEQPASLVLDLTPRWWETTVVRVLALVAAVLLVGAGMAWRLRLARRRAEALEATVAERTGALRVHEAQLEARNAQLAEFVASRSRLFANLSHEFRTPLTLIIGPLRSLLEGRHGPLGPTVREQGELMERNGQRLLRLINQVLDLSRLQAGAVTLAARPGDLAAFVRATTLAFAPLAERRRITLAVEADDGALPVAFDAEQLEKVLLNLLSNAFKFTEPGGRVTVAAHADGDAAVVTVRDTGVGIAPAQLAHVFDRFWQADTSATRRHEGTGIGLALARELVELHGGSIEARSELGAGSTFTVRLPLLRGAAATIAAARPTAGAPRITPVQVEEAMPVGAGAAAEPKPGEPDRDGDLETDRTTVLLVDDNADVRAFVRSLLGATYRVLEAADGRAGLAAARAALPDLIVADVMMPELDGLGLGRALREDPMTDAIPLVLLTARADTEDQVAGLGTGADVYLTKPFEPAVLEATVASLLTQRRRLRDRFAAGDAPPIPARAASDPAIAAAPAVPSALERRLRPLVEARLTDALDPAKLADLAGMSYHQLYRGLREATGESPSRFIRRLRVERAAVLLEARVGNVSEVAYSVGFESLSHFSRAFADRFGVPPSTVLRGETVPSLPAGRPAGTRATTGRD